MKAVILAGGLGTRLSEETYDKPKPMVEIGGKPILWHIMKIYASHGIKDFIICCGYKGYYIKEYFYNYALHNSNIEFKLSDNDFKLTNNNAENWSVNCVDTGQETQTGGRLKRAKEHLIPGESFLFTYGDGVGDIDITKVIESHNLSKKIATVTAVNPPGRFGALNINDDGSVNSFDEKPARGNTWINGGFFVLETDVFDYIEGDNMPWEDEPLKRITNENQLNSYKHYGFWQPMDTIREKSILEEMYQSGTAPWVTW
ncbi:glucose-1-phosphate cytidylyltransferase [Gammaproteobacteria bacterium]|nr:glucose-1-phosphate cytidylyltransferase [Gammaproteobacteria bacterium]